MDADMQPFEAEVGRVLDLVINSLYQHREIFLRELISNASDACDRLRYASLTEPGLLGDDPELKILIVPDKAANTLTVRDNGIGMSRDELAGNLGTIARSGTQSFVSQLSGDAAKDVRLIGQFGPERAPLALGVASLLFGFPIFFDAGLVVMLPIIFSVASRFGGSVLLYALPSAGAFAVMHAFLPPHPGPVAASELLGADIGLLVLVGLVLDLTAQQQHAVVGVDVEMHPVAQLLLQSHRGLQLDALVFQLGAGGAAIGGHQGAAHHGAAHHQGRAATQRGQAQNQGQQQLASVHGIRRRHPGRAVGHRWHRRAHAAPGDGFR